MRHDIANILLTKPLHKGNSCRRSSGKGKGSGKLGPLEERPIRESMRGFSRVRHEGNVYDGTNALKRFLLSQLGSSWNQIYSDICQQVPSSHPAWQRVKSYLDFRVECRIKLINGKPFTTGPLWQREVYGGDFWVHPDTGVLHYVSPKRYRYGSTKPSFKQVCIDELHKYVQIKGIWYKVTFVEVPKVEVPGLYDIVLNHRLFCMQGRCEQDWLIREWGALICAVSKQQIGSREIRQNRLKAAS